MKKYIWALLMIVFASCAAWADVMEPYISPADVMEPHTTLQEEWGEFVKEYAISGYILFVFISFWVLFPLHMKEKKRLLAISLLLPVVWGILFFNVCPIVADWIESLNHEKYWLQKGEVTAVYVVYGVLLLLDIIFIFFVFKRGWKYLLVQILLYSILFALPILAKDVEDRIRCNNLGSSYLYEDGKCISLEEKECRNSGGLWVGRCISLEEKKCRDSGGLWLDKETISGCIPAHFFH